MNFSEWELKVGHRETFASFSDLSEKFFIVVSVVKYVIQKEITINPVLTYISGKKIIHYLSRL